MNAIQPSASNGPRYDLATMFFHWATAVLVVTLFATAQIWSFLAKGTPLRHNLQGLHISLGILLTAAIVGRLLWRLTRGRRLASHQGMAGLAAKAGHGLLYALLLAQIVLGFMFRWAQGESFDFFGLFAVPALMAPNPDWKHTLGGLHENVAWALIILSGLHACVALVHHWWLKDSVLLRMLPENR
ncbi:cytochrome b [Pseudomonas syringae]|uniref:cytochrome b n=1 Tax=Pseudomonas syringae TaxID=317 RepID=UPI00034A0234|nr:cytochrome b [Pseudomonas syringae]NAS96839.1 cytochrome b [Pseudomonas syringae pv. actinidifoliorum]NAT23120.1 cytochrome b [Pseudomonas syringae pv. actinidifoliorum]NAT65746.1 cytochrome b [Pseudomonas syringae pv. actinidifoliorum]